MADSARQRFNFTWSLAWQWLQKFGAVITVIAIAVFGFWGGHFLLPGQDHSPAEHVAEDHDSDSSQSSDAPSSVTLSKEKYDNARLVVAQLDATAFQSHQAIPGTIAFDATKKLELRATVDSVVKQTLVKPNQFVKQGEPLVILTGPEIGAARGEISQCQSTVALLQKEHAWTVETHRNIKALLELLKRSPTTEQISLQFDDKKLGEHRNEILSAYSELQLAKQLSAQTDRLVSQGAISGKTARQRKSGNDVAAAKFNSIREEMSFQIKQQLDQSQAKLAAEKKRLAICKEKLSALLGSNTEVSDEHELNAEDNLLEEFGGDTQSESNGSIGTSEFVIKAPQSGQIVLLPAVTSSRFQPGEVIAEIADTSDVWVEAQVSQQDWHSLNLATDQQLSVRIPAVPDRTFEANVRHIAASVSKDTMAIPIVAELKNDNDKFRPGMSVWVDIPTSEIRNSIVVPTGAVQRKADAAFVFVKTGDRTFEKRDVVLGEESESQIEIVSGLSDSDTVVVEGSFFLKSEMLLAEEEE